MKQRALLVLIIVLIAMPFLGMWYSPSVPFKPDFPNIEPLAARQEAFINFMVPKINFSNNEVLKTRAQILNLINIWQESGRLPYSDRSWLREIADVYQVSNFNIDNPKSLNELLSRVDIIPASLILAQSGDESGWGASRFAVLADNFFGQHCYVSGCGILPLGSTSAIGFEVQKFDTVQDSIDDYLYNLNTNPSYAAFRAMRAELRTNNQPLVGFRLVSYLKGYSTLGDRYVLRISSIIINQNLMQYDAINDQILN